MKIIYQAQKEYPEKLNNIYSSPAKLYLVGDELVLKKPSIAIIGCRDASDYGKRVAFNFAYELAKEGFVIVSGLARGIDTYAHLGAVKANGKTIAVLGSGLKHIYPAENKEIEIANSMEKIRVMLGFAPEDYAIKRMPDMFIKNARNKTIIINPDITKYSRKIIETSLIQAFCKTKHKENSKEYKALLKNAIEKYENYEYRINKVS